MTLLRDTRARIVYARPPRAFLDWWAARQIASAGPGRFDADDWLVRTESQLRAIEEAVATRPPGHDLHLSVPDPAEPIEGAGPTIPPAVMDAQARIAWTTMRWLDDVADSARPSLRTGVLPGPLARWLPALAEDPCARIPGA